MPFITQNFLASTIKANGVTLSSSFDYSQLDIETDPTTFFPKTGKQEFGFTQQWGPEANEYRQADLGEGGSGLYNNGFDGPENLDIETNPTTFFPKTGKQEFGFTQQWGPEANEYILNPQGQLQGGNLKKQDLYKIDDESIASLNPVINVPSNKHQQIYNPLNQYEDSPQGKLRSPVSAAEKNNFKTSGLDLEDSLAGVEQGVSGGPNRTNSVRINSGQYTVKRAGGMGFSGNDVGGSVVTQTLHRYTPTNGYYDTLIGKPLQTLPKDGTNIALPNNADGPYDDTLK
jgi:hypothetical protein